MSVSDPYETVIQWYLFRMYLFPNQIKNITQFQNIDILTKLINKENVCVEFSHSLGNLVAFEDHLLTTERNECTISTQFTT